MREWILGFRDGMDYGMGVDILSGVVGGRQVEPGDVRAIDGADGQTTQYSLRIANSTKEVSELLDAGIKVSGKYGFYQGEAKVRYRDSLKLRSESTYIVATCVVRNPYKGCQSPSLTKVASDLLKAGKLQRFRELCGDGYISGIAMGGEFSVTIQVTAKTRKEQEDISASLQAEMNGFLASAKVNSSLNESKYLKSSSTSIEVSTYQRGGHGGQAALVSTLADAVDRLKAFPEIVANSPVPYFVKVSGYENLPWPVTPNLYDIRLQEQVLEGCSKVIAGLTTKINDIDFIVVNPGLFQSTPPHSQLLSWKSWFESELQRCYKCASVAAEDPAKAQFFQEAAPPQDFVLPPRKEGETPLLPIGRCSLRSVNYPDHYVRHSDFLASVTQVTTDLDRSDSTFVAVPGLADNQALSFESVNYPGCYLRHMDYRVRLDQATPDSQFRSDATFRPVKGLTGGNTISLQCINLPGYYVRHRDWEVHVDPFEDTELFRADASFERTAGLG